MNSFSSPLDLFQLEATTTLTWGASAGYPVAIIDRNRPVFYCVPAALYEQMLDELDEKDLVQMITERQNQPLREVDLNQYL